MFTCNKCSELKCSGACGISVNLNEILDRKTYKEVINKRNNVLEEYLELSSRPEFKDLKDNLFQKKVFSKLHKVTDLEDLESVLAYFECLIFMMENKSFKF